MEVGKVAAIFLIGDTEKVDRFCDAEMVVQYYGHDVINPLNFPEIWELTEAMIDAADTVMLLKGWQNSESASKQYVYAKEQKKNVIIYSPKSKVDLQKAEE